MFYAHTLPATYDDATDLERHVFRDWCEATGAQEDERGAWGWFADACRAFRA
jgi:hypothetical protein